MVDILWNLGHKTESFYSKPDKYCLLAKEHDNYRFLYLDDILKNKEYSFPQFVVSFVAREGVVLMIANLINNVCVSMVLRSLSRKAFIDYGASKSIFYGIGELSNFKYGYPIILVEGVADRDALLSLYPYVFAVKSAGLSLVQGQFISRLTNKVILMFDNDDAGKNGSRRTQKRLEELGVKTYTIHHPGVKDSGTLYEYLAANNTHKYNELKAEYFNLIKGAVLCLKR